MPTTAILARERFRHPSAIEKSTNRAIMPEFKTELIKDGVAVRVTVMCIDVRGHKGDES